MTMPIESNYGLLYFTQAFDHLKACERSLSKVIDIDSDFQVLDNDNLNNIYDILNNITKIKNDIYNSIDIHVRKDIHDIDIRNIEKNS